MKRWTHFVGDDEYAEAKYVDIGPVLGLRVGAGHSVLDAWPCPTITIYRGALPDSFRCGLMKVVSPRIRRWLEMTLHGEDLDMLEFLPVRVEGVESEFFFCNFLGDIDAIDRTRSAYSLRGEWTRMVDHLVVDETKTRNRELFRLKSLDDIVLASDRLVDEYVSQGFTGIGFVPVETSGKPLLH